MKSKFRVCEIWALNLATMVKKFSLSEVFIIAKEEGIKNAYQSDTMNSNNNGHEVEVAIDLLNIAITFQAIPNLVLTTSINAFEPIAHFYVEMPESPTTPTNN
jgi:hypothetical protein